MGEMSEREEFEMEMKSLQLREQIQEKLTQEIPKLGNLEVLKIHLEAWDLYESSDRYKSLIGGAAIIGLDFLAGKADELSKLMEGETE